MRRSRCLQAGSGLIWIKLSAQQRGPLMRLRWRAHGKRSAEPAKDAGPMTHCGAQRLTEQRFRQAAAYFRQLALEQNLTSMASDLPDLPQVPGGHATLVHAPPEQLPMPVIR